MKKIFIGFIIVFCVISGLDAAAPKNTEAQKYRELWYKRSAGKNLALGKKVAFTIQPNYRLTRNGNSDSTDLTDGMLSSRKDGTIWFDRLSVGWGFVLGSGVDMRLDLGKVLPIDRVVLRCLAGRNGVDEFTPDDFQVLVSKDGRKWYSAAQLKRLMPGEKDQSDFKTCFYLPEPGVPYVYPMEIKIDCNARYLNIRVSSAKRYFMTDELAVMEASPKLASSPDFDKAYEGETVPFFTSGILIAPHKNYFAISRNIITPNFLLARDMRSAAEQKNNLIKAVVELPKGIELISPSKAETKDISINGKAYKQWIIPYNIKQAVKNPFFFKVSPEYQDDGNAVAVFYALAGKHKPNKVKVPLKIINIPEVSGLKFNVSLAWMYHLMTDSASHSFSNSHYPEFFDAWPKMGFNALGAEPWIWWVEKNARPAQIPDRKALLQRARKHGFKIIMIHSLDGMLLRYSGKHREIYCQDPKGKSHNLCPSYQGKYYQENLQCMRECLELAEPDYVFWDMEAWYHARKYAKTCARCIAGQKASGKSMDEYLFDQGTRLNRDLYETVERYAKEKNVKMPIVASYDRSVNKPVYGTEVVKRIYPKYIKQLQPSLYVAGDAQKVHDSIRKNYLEYKTRNIIPWLTAGTYGEFASYKLEQMIYEAMLNGAGGFTYYRYYDFDTPTDFYYHSKALKTLAPYQELIMNGEILAPQGANKQMTYSGVRKGNEMLLLTGNYLKCSPETAFKTPFKKLREVKNLLSGEKLENNTEIKFNVPKGGQALLYIQGE